MNQYQPLITQQVEENKPSDKTIRHLIRNQFKFERRQYIFHTINTINLILTAFNLISPINIEAQESLLYYEQISQMQNDKVIRLLNLVAALIVMHLIRIFNSILGYFSLGQKSGHLLTFFMIISTFCVLGRGIITLMIVINFDAIQETCMITFQSQLGENIDTTMAIQFVIVLVLFMIVEILLTLISLIQCSKSKEEYASTKIQKDKLMNNFSLCFDVAINQFID